MHIDIVKENYTSIRHLINPCFVIMFYSFVCMQTINMKQINGFRFKSVRRIIEI